MQLVGLLWISSIFHWLECQIVKCCTLKHHIGIDFYKSQTMSAMTELTTWEPHLGARNEHVWLVTNWLGAYVAGAWIASFPGQTKFQRCSKMTRPPEGAIDASWQQATKLTCSGCSLSTPPGTARSYQLKQPIWKLIHNQTGLLCGHVSYPQRCIITG